jgi:predicted AlkP superfamily phosphohydrolase/phosphomutase
MTRTLFIGLDGATFTVLDEMTRELPGVGITMPFLKQFIENGVRTKLKSTPNPLTPPAWASIMTGRSPGNHGIYDFIRAEEKGNEVYFTLYDARDLDAETLWSIASRQGRQVVALNFPLTAPPRRNSGSIVPGFVPWKHLRRNISPPELYVRLKGIPNFNPKDLAWDFELEKQALEDLSEADMENWVRYHLPREEQWYRIAEFLLKEGQPDFMAAMFDGTDKIQHQAWQFLDPALVKSQPSKWEARMREVCLSYFRHLDRYIESLVRLAGPGVQVFMASDHGFTATTEVLRINTFLHQRGYLKWKAYGDSAVEQRRNESNFANVDWNETLAYCRTPSSNGITIRVAQRPGDPGIRPEDYTQFRDRIIDDLRSIKDEQTGEPLIKEIMKREDVFPGPYMKNAPDLTLVLRDHGFVSIRNLEPLVMKRKAPAGTHHPDGIFLAGGRGVERGLVSECRNIVDVAPTLLYSLGLPVPEDLEGEVSVGFFTKEFVAANPVIKGAPTLPVQDGEVESKEITEDEKARLITQLRMLGYME